MSNLSYCRFENTLTDLRDCLDFLNEEKFGSMSDSELRNATVLVKALISTSEFLPHCLDKLENEADRRRSEECSECGNTITNGTEICTECLDRVLAESFSG